MSLRAIYKLETEAKAQEVLSLLDTVRSNRQGIQTVGAALADVESQSEFSRDTDGSLASGTYLIKINHNDCLSALARKFGLGDEYGQDLYLQNKNNNNFVKSANLIIEGGYLVFTVDEEPVGEVAATNENNPAIESENNGTAIQNTPQHTAQNGTASGTPASHAGQAKAGGVDAYSQETFERVAEYARESIERREGLEEKEIQEIAEGQEEEIEEGVSIRLVDAADANNKPQHLPAYAPYAAAFAQNAKAGWTNYDVYMPSSIEPSSRTQKAWGVSNPLLGKVEYRHTLAPDGRTLSKTVETKVGAKFTGGVIAEAGVAEGNLLIQGGIFAPATSVAGTNGKAGLEIGAGGINLRSKLIEICITGESALIAGVGGAVKILMEPEVFYKVRDMARNESVDAALSFLKSTGQYAHVSDELLRKAAMVAGTSAFAAALADLGLYMGIKGALGMAGVSEKSQHTTALAGTATISNALRLQDPRALKIISAIGKVPFMAAGIATADAGIDLLVDHHPDFIDGPLDVILGDQPSGDFSDDPLRRLVVKGLVGLKVGEKFVDAGRVTLPWIYQRSPLAVQSMVQSAIPYLQVADDVLDRYALQIIRSVLNHPVIRAVGSVVEPVVGGVFKTLTSAPVAGAMMLSAGYASEIEAFEKAEKPVVRQRLEPSMEVLAHTWGSRTTEINSENWGSLSASEQRGLTKLADTFNNALWWKVDNIWDDNTPDFKSLYTVLEDADVKAVVSKYPEDFHNEISRFMLDYCYATDVGTIDTPSDWEGNIKRYDEYGAHLLAYMDTIMGMKNYSFEQSDNLEAPVDEAPENTTPASVSEPVEYSQSFDDEFEFCPVNSSDYLASSSDYLPTSY